MAMQRSWSRRDFLRTTVEGSLVVGASFVPAWARSAAPGAAFSAREREMLRLAMDELIPGQPGHPAASDVGGLASLETRAAAEEAFAAQLKRFIRVLDESGHGHPFARLDPNERVERLRAVEKTAADLFAAFRDAVYEAYYTQPQIWRRIGYEFHAGIEPRPSIVRFDESALATVRRLPTRYREVAS